MFVVKPLGPLETGCINKSDWQSEEVGNALSAVSSQTRGTVYKGQFFTHKSVEQCRFSYVWPADNSDGIYLIF